jgi:cell division protein FtsI/penicillin-binding protein 2
MVENKIFRQGIRIKGMEKISLARGFELSSNTVMVRAVYENYKDNPSKFVNVNSYGFNKKLNMDFEGEEGLLFPQTAIKAGLIFRFHGWPSVWSFGNTNGCIL